MKEGIAFDDKILELFMQKTGLPEAQAKANIKYIHNRLREFMDEEDTHSIRLNGHSTVVENLVALKRQYRKNINPKFKEYLQRRIENLNNLVAKVDEKHKAHNLRRTPFISRRIKFKMTDEQLEKKQNEQE